MVNTYKVKKQGFHGTSETIGQTICDTQTYVYKKNLTHWLGQGIYFFDEDPGSAKLWARFQVNEGEYGTILETTIEVESDNYLNLDSRDGLFRCHEYFAAVKHKLGEILNMSLEVADVKRMRCALFDLIPKSEIYVIKRTFDVDKQPGYIAGSFSRLSLDLKSPQICVRVPGAIVKDSIGVHDKVQKAVKIRKPTSKKKKRALNFI